LDNRNILISGAGIAGPALAYWLGRYGFQCTVVERAPALREGGYAVDFRGPAHLGVLQRMGILEEVRRRQTNMGEVTVVDAAGKPLLRLPSSFMSGEVEVLRGDLSRILYDSTRDTTEYIFGDSIASLHETSADVEVTFEHGASRTFDMVVGADGMHSRVRVLAFGPEAVFIRHSGYAIADFTISNVLGLDHAGLIYNEPGRGVMVTSARNPAEASVGLVFASGALDGDLDGIERQKALLAETFRGMQWHVPRLIEAMWDVPDLYFDTISQVHIDHFSSGRVVLLGDAGYGATVGGLGTGLAIVCAYVLAGELAAANGDYRTAFTRYEDEIRDYGRGCQKIGDGVGPFLAPRTRAAIWRRNQMYRLLSLGPLVGVFNRLTTKAASAITLKGYPELQRERGSGKMLMSGIG
jgi:2-polyprenyl-6-methoxyphenol hydroxylase-like FAD-dependent oxidoreductase